MTALLSQEGSVIAAAITRGVVPKPPCCKVRFGTTPALRATPPDSGGECVSQTVNLLTAETSDHHSVRQNPVFRNNHNPVSNVKPGPILMLNSGLIQNPHARADMRIFI